MSSPFGRMLLIANPAAGKGRAATLPRLQAALTARGLEHETAITDHAGHAETLARDAVTSGDLRFVVAVGGDGTVQEVVNGLIDAETGKPHRDDTVLGIVPAGTGCDFARTFGLDRAPEKLAKHLDGDGLFPIDIGRIHMHTEDGQPTVRLFHNIANVAYGGMVIKGYQKLPRFMGQARYLVAILGVVREFKRIGATVELAHTTVSDEISNIVIANGQFFGSGMKVAPRAIPDDDRFNVQVARGKASDVFKLTPKMMKGEHLPHPDISEYQSPSVDVETAEPVYIEADGELMGMTPARFDILHKVISLKI